MAQQVTERWRTGRTQVSQFTRWTGLAYLADDALHVSGADTPGIHRRLGLARHRCQRARASGRGQQAALLFRVQGAQRSYAFGFTAHGTVALMKKKEPGASCPSSPCSGTGQGIHCIEAYGAA